MQQRYGDRLPPVHLTENGSAEHDIVAADGQVYDTDRVQYLADHLAALRADPTGRQCCLPPHSRLGSFGAYCCGDDVVIEDGRIAPLVSLGTGY